MLTVIGASSQVALRHASPGSEIHTCLTEIAAAGDRAANLTRQLLAFSRPKIEASKVIDLAGVIRGVASLLRRVIGEDVDLETVLAHNLAPIRADAGQIEQVVMNLAVNARDAMPGGGVLTIEAANAEPAHVLLRVRDTGHGMSAEVQSRIFEPFFTTKEIGKGTGLGLSTVYGIVEQLGGRVTFRSEPGKGTTFSLSFPQADLRAAGHPPAHPSATPVGGVETVLLVEDEPAVRSLVRRALEEHGYHVLTAANGREALEVHGRHEGPLHALVTDVVMPEMGGREVVEHLCPLRPEMRVLFISGHSDDSSVRSGIDKYGAAYLPKPFALETLVASVQALLRPRS
jgi:CheY-like chemotaxis protein